MRRTAVAIVAGLVAMAGLVLGGPAHADTNAALVPECDEIWINNQNDGNMWAWRDINCSGTLLGVTQGNDDDWADTRDAFKTTDNDEASSVMNTGTYANGVNAVMFFRNTRSEGFGGHTCLKRGELYADNLTDNTFTDGVVVNDKISAHRWVRESACARFVTSPA
jgi:hypothetical protein